MQRLDRRRMLLGLSVLGGWGCSRAGELCRSVVYSLLDVQQWSTWELCGQGRRAQVSDAQLKAIVSDGGMFGRAIVGTSVDASRILVYDTAPQGRRSPGTSIVLCDTAGRRLRSLDVPFTDRFSEIRSYSDGRLVVAGRMPRMKEYGIYEGNWETGDWKEIHILKGLAPDGVWLSCGNGDCVASLPSGVLAIGRGEKRWLKVKGSRARLSPDGTRMLIWSPWGPPSLVRYPSLEPLETFYDGRVGQLSEWSPDSQWILFEGWTWRGPGMTAVHATTGVSVYAGLARLFGSAGHAIRWVKWGEKGPAALPEFAANYLKGVSG